MTKTFLLAATAITAIALGGAAQAGSIDMTSTVGGVTLTNTTAAYGAFTVASEATDVTSTNAVVAPVSIVNKITSAQSVAVGATNVYEVIFTPSGGGKFSGTSTIAATVTGGTPTIAYTQLGLLADGTVSALVSITGAVAASSVSGFTLSSNVISTSETDLKVAASVNLIASGVRIAVDSTSATTVVQYKPLIATAALTATSNSVAAALPNYTSFRTPGLTTTQATAALASAIKLNANAATANADGKFYGAVKAAPAEATLANVVTGGTVTVIGTAGAQLDKLSPKLATLSPATATLTDTTAIFTVAPATAEATAIVAGGLALGLTEPSTAIALNAATYTVSFLPTFAADFTASTTAFGPVAAGAVTLEGTNFTAPWFTLNNANNNATLRIANNGTTMTGPVFATLKANNGTAAPTTARVQISAGLAPNATLDVLGSALATLFGTNAQNGDLQITIQGDGAVLSAKTRIRNIASGATFETSLGTLTGK